MTYYLGRKGEKLGPYSLAELEAMKNRGEVLADDLAWGEGMASWLPAAQVLGSAGSIPPVVYPPPAAATYAPTPGFSSAFPVPPSLHWGLVLLFGICTCGIFSLVWLFIEANFVKKLDPKSKGATMFALYLGLYAAGIGTGILGAAGGSDFRVMGSLISGVAYIGALVCLLVGVFDMRKSLETHYNSVEPMGLKLSGVMTFFFHFLYFQYHFTRIAALKQTGART